MEVDVLVAPQEISWLPAINNVIFVNRTDFILTESSTEINNADDCGHQRNTGNLQVPSRVTCPSPPIIDAVWIPSVTSQQTNHIVATVNSLIRHLKWQSNFILFEKSTGVYIL